MMFNEDNYSKNTHIEYRKSLTLIFKNIERIFSILENIFEKLKKKENVTKNGFLNKFLKTFWLMLAFTVILCCYYFYIYVKS